MLLHNIWIAWKSLIGSRRIAGNPASTSATHGKSAGAKNVWSPTNEWRPK